MDLLSYRTDPRVYGKCGPAALKDFVTYKHLPRSKPHVSGIKSTEQHTTKDSTFTSPKRSPPKTVQVIQQTLNRRALGPKKLFNPSQVEPKQPYEQHKFQDIIRRTANRKRNHKEKWAPKRNPRSTYHKYNSSATTRFRYRRIRISTTNNSPSLTIPAAKRIDIKATPEHKSPEIRRSTRPRKGTLTTKFGNAIPIGQISDSNEPPIVIAVIQEATATVSKQSMRSNILL